MTRKSKSSDSAADDPIMKEIGPGVNIYEKPISPNIILRPFLLTERIVEETRRINNENFGHAMVSVPARGFAHGLTEYIPTVHKKAGDAFVDFQESPLKPRILKFIKETMNMRSGKFYTLKKLVELGNINESEVDLYRFPAGISDFPYREITHYTRELRPDRSEYLRTFESITGITDQGVVVSRTGMELNSYLRPTIFHEKRNLDGTPLQQGANISTTETMQASIIKEGDTREPIGVIEHLTNFKEHHDVVLSSLKYASSSAGINEFGGAQTTIHREGDAKSYLVADVEEWLDSDFKELYQRHQPRMPGLPGANTGVQPYS
jgi:hypothetical protein